MNAYENKISQKYENKPLRNVSDPTLGGRGKGGGHISLAQSQASASLDFLILSLVLERRPSLDSLQKSVTDGAAAAIFFTTFLPEIIFFQGFFS